MLRFLYLFEISYGASHTGDTTTCFDCTFGYEVDTGQVLSGSKLCQTEPIKLGRKTVPTYQEITTNSGLGRKYIMRYFKVTFFVTLSY